MDKKPPHDQLIWNTIQKTRQLAGNPPLSNKIPPSLNNLTVPANKPILQKSFSASPAKIKLSLNKNCNVLVKPSNSQVATILAKVPGASYNLKSNEWTFPILNYEDVTKLFVKSRLIFDKIPLGTLHIARKNFSTDSYVLQDGIYDLLMDFQRDAVNFAINRNGRILLADDMGLGKTIQALAIANYYKLEYPLLIICPASLCYNWADSIKRFLGDEALIIHEKSDFNTKIAVISYNQAVTFISTLQICKYGVVICDECHYLKSTTSKRTKTLLPVLQKASRLVMISGTPATSRPVELYPILCALDKNLYPVFQEYGNRYCNGRKIGHYFDYKGCTNAVELGTVIEKAFMIRRLKGDVLRQLPIKFRRQIILDAGVKKRCEFKKTDIIGDPDAQVMQEYREAVGIKKEAVIKYLEGVVEKGVKCLVFGHHKEMLDALEEFCIEKGVKFIRIDGTTVSGKRQELVEQFQNKEEVRVAVLSLTACSTGLTLTSGKAVVFAELYWNPGTMLQAEDRVHRIGQRENVDVHYLVAKNTIDEVVWPKLLEKLTVLESLGMSKNELRNVGDSGQSRLEFKRTNC